MWNNRYSTEEYVFGKAPSQFVTKYAQRLKPNSKILLPADGEGRNSCYLASLGHEVFASDYSEIGLEKAKKLAKELGVNVHFSLVDIENDIWPENEYDAIFAVFIQFSPPEARLRVFEGMKKALKKGGTLFLHGYTPKQIEYKTGGPPCAENMYDSALLKAAFADMDIEILKEYDQHLEEGGGHNGISALIDFVGVKVQIEIFDRKLIVLPIL